MAHVLQTRALDNRQEMNMKTKTKIKAGEITNPPKVIETPAGDKPVVGTNVYLD